MAADFLVLAALLLRIVRAFFMGTNLAIPQLQKYLCVCGIHEAWLIISPFYVLVQL